MPRPPAGDLQPATYRWNHRGRSLRIAFSDSGGRRPAWLLLPALSTISSRAEWQPLSDALSCDAPRLISVDWPGFGESERPRLPYTPEVLADFLRDFRRDRCPADCGLIAAGHGAGLALLAAERHGLQFREWLLVAPTWRGPLPTMAGRRRRVFAAVRGLVEMPLLGPLLYRLNTSRAVLGWMSRRHVDVAGPGLTREGLVERQRIARQPGARFASAAFVTGGLDPYGDPRAWLTAARSLRQPLTVVIADQSPPRSLASMQALASVAHQVAHLPGRLGAHQECGKELSALLR
ncbi:MAG: hypothetical protein ER33_15425 [Cyanobium sp. CACIAM 14]|nr:MAG: hypothetical protein ER33_15425 [Cyanobium sp. CACIAM 14]